MEILNNILLFAAKLGLALVALVIIARWAIVPYLWWHYDKPIETLIDNFEKFKSRTKNEANGRGIPSEITSTQISAEEQRTMERVGLLKLKRQHFLDRVNLLLTISSLNK